MGGRILKQTYSTHNLEIKHINKLCEQNLHGGLYIVSTPIGNIFDITIRAIYILKRSKYIFAEDTRVARKLADFFDIRSQIISCNNYTEITESITNRCLENRNKILSLISDAGTPLISDPGYQLVNWCLENSINVYPVPGACSPICALSVSGLSTDEFHFVGFLPRKSSERSQKLKSLSGINSSLIFLESPNRLVSSLKNIAGILGNRPAYVGRELTKLFEEHKRGYLSDLIEYFENHEPIGEFVIVVGKPENASKEIGADDIRELLTVAMQSMSLKDAVTCVKEKTDVSKKNVYAIALELINGHR